MKQQRILIAGGGMVGMSLALLLDQHLPEGAAITVVEGMALRTDQPASSYHPSFDARSTALSYSTAHLYRGLGVWDSLTPGLGPIQKIHVSRRGGFGSSVLTAREQEWDALGWVVENPCLGQCLLRAVAERPRIELRCPARVSAAEPEGYGMRVTVNDRSGDDASEESREELVDLLVIADGAESDLREQLGFLTRRKAYGQSAIVANLSFPKDHEGCAFERFTQSGPLALLPLPGTSQDPHRMALVWSLPPDDAERLVAADEDDFSRALVDAFGYRLGRPKQVGTRQAYPLALTEAVEQIRRGCAVLGNAAHSLHPVAGQGYNLALRDASSLAVHLAEACDNGEGVGDPVVLRRYQDESSADQSQTIAASDGLPRLFMLTDPLVALGRDLALGGMDFFPVLRRQFVREAAGMAALESTSV
ncbi:MAG: 2-octaprenyl-6-methoxyphenyl hydroxylase [Pseudomonadota bacterium]